MAQKKRKRLTKAQRRRRKKILGLVRLGCVAAVFIGVIVLVTVLVVRCSKSNAAKREAEIASMEAEAASIMAAAQEKETETTTPAPIVHTAEEYAEAGVNEALGVPILMYHRIFEMSNSETEYTGGNVDVDGYNRTSEAFEADLEQYYEWGYRCIRLEDFLNGKVDVEFGYSPIIITFDDGIQQALIDGFDGNGDPIFTDYSALAIMENMKKKHPDFNMTATFFLNGGLFGNGDEKDRELLNWAVDNGYDIGNHTWTHSDLADLTADEIEEEVGSVYNKLEDMIPGKYVHIVALPFGSPTDTSSDSKFDRIFSGTWEGKDYYSYCSLLCAWTYQESMFRGDIDMTYIKRIRGYDNNGDDFDIEMNFDILNGGQRYVSDGDPDTVAVPEEDEDLVGDLMGRKIKTY